MIFALAGIVPATLVAGNFRQLKQPVQYPPLHEKGGASKKIFELEGLFRYASVFLCFITKMKTFFVLQSHFWGNDLLCALRI